MIQFLLNDEMIELTSFAPNLSVLDWLRTDMGKVGSKEGCASGDCGACTIVVGNLINVDDISVDDNLISVDDSINGHVNCDSMNKKWHYRSINACLMLLGNMHGKHIITVEALTTKMNPDIEDLHPVQRAMVEYHGSQCGFCTPGFIMSLFVLYMNHTTYPGKVAVIQALGGNLCRCTGYQPILKAAEHCFTDENKNNITDKNHRFSQQVDLLTESLQQALTQNQIPAITNGQQHFYLPQNLSQLCTLKTANPQAKFVAGATDLSVEFSQQLTNKNQLISVRYCPELMQFESDDSGLHIGAALPYSEFVARFCDVYPEAHELFERLGSLQVRNAGSLGGSIANASPIGDPAPLLIALNATIEVQSTRGKRMLDLAEFFIDYRKTQLAEDEVIVTIHVPKRVEGFKLSCHKISKRIEDDISAVCLVLAYQYDDEKMQQTRCAMGGMAATPALAKQVAESLKGKAFTLENLQLAAEKITIDFQPLSDVRASSAYRIQVSKNLLSRIWYQAQQNVQPTSSSVQITNAAPIIHTRVNHATL